MGKQMSSEARTAPPSVPEIADCLRRALEEDIGNGDLTTNRIVPKHQEMLRWKTSGRLPKQEWTLSLWER